MSVMPPIYAILCLLWITNFAIYAVVSTVPSRQTPSGIFAPSPWHSRPLVGGVVVWITRQVTNEASQSQSFLNSDLDLMKRVIWLSLASSGLYFIITLVSSFDWRKYGSGSSNDVGIYRLENVNINTNDTGGQHISSSTQDS